MTTFAIDNTPVSVTLDDNETYSPASGSVQKLKIQVSQAERLFINNLQIANIRAGSGEPNVDEITVIATDNDTLESGSENPVGGIHISGFEVN